MPKLTQLVDGAPVTVAAAEPLAGAAERLVVARAGAACVVGDGGELTGILTERDVLHACAGGADPSETTVGEWMTADPVTADAGDEAAAALQVMIDRGFRHLPVLRDGEIAGIVSMRVVSITLQRARMG
jgi:CBS domain-containing protein